MAARYLEHGYSVLARNWRCGEGEIDLVLLDPGRSTVVFCEVKTRRSSTFGSPLEAVTATKQRRLRRLATRWLAENRSVDRTRGAALRFDVGAVHMDGRGRLRLEIVEAAF